jgi:hypothetical protein
VPEIEPGDGQLAYPCPHCQIMLKPPGEPWQGWVRCPRCGRPGLPPLGLQHAPARKRQAALRDPRTSATKAQSDSALGPSPETAGETGRLPDEQDWTAWRAGDGLRFRSSSSPWLLIARTGAIVSAFLLLVAWLDRSFSK